MGALTRFADGGSLADVPDVSDAHAMSISGRPSSIAAFVSKPLLDMLPPVRRRTTP
jgi:hypothetical protein